ncbi:hypothetical protein, partial [Escherichia coli]|uniref:hypothetical protein n=1 Tax=Escherichia coli TaxID=562 RepID=UPI003F7DE350
MLTNRSSDIAVLRHRLSIKGGKEAALGFSFIAGSTATSDSSGNLRRYCPFLSDDDTNGLTSCTILLMMAVNRIAQINL